MIPTGVYSLGYFGGAPLRSWRPLQIAQQSCKAWDEWPFCITSFFDVLMDADSI